jgi:hypothetical protein
MKTAITLLVAMMAATACDGGVEPHATAEPQDEEGVFDPMTDQIDKAKQVEEAAMQRKAELDEAIEKPAASSDDP